jgi:hypothetical protein
LLEQDILPDILVEEVKQEEKPVIATSSDMSTTPS